MNQVISLLLMLCIAVALHSQEPGNDGKFFIIGKIAGQDTGFIHLNYIDKYGKFIKDSSSIQGGDFSFIGYINAPFSAVIHGNIKSRSVSDPNTTEIFLVPDSMEIFLKKDDFKKAVILGSSAQNEMNVLETMKAPIRTEMKPLVEDFKKIRDSLVRDGSNKMLYIKDSIAKRKLGPYEVRLKDIAYKYIVSHPGSHVSAYWTMYLMSGLSDDSLRMFYKSFSPSVQNGFYGKIIAERIGGQPGCMAKDFNSVSSSGDSISLSLFKGKRYVLLDFWATWCIPCRNNNSHLIELYTAYHIKGLEIIGIANDDTRREAWKKAIIDDKTEIWYHILQEYGSENDIGKSYGVGPIPAKILIDKNGLIVGRYEGDNDLLLDKKLVEIFK